MNEFLSNTTHESLDVGATPVVRHFLQRLGFFELLERHLTPTTGRPPALPHARTLTVLVTNLLIARRPLYAIPGWVARRAPESLNLTPDQVAFLNDDRIGTALDHLYHADRASLLTQLVMRTVQEFELNMTEFHQDTTTVTFSGQYDTQAPAEAVERPARITFGYNKDHRPDLKQLLYSVTIGADGAVPVHAKVYDGNTSDCEVHIDTWTFLYTIVNSSDFLYVADSKLCTRENMEYIHSRKGRFLTVMPATRSEYQSFRTDFEQLHIQWSEVHREPNPRRRDGPDLVYHGWEHPQRSSEGYRVLWYHSSQKEQMDRDGRQQRVKRAKARLDQWNEDARPSRVPIEGDVRQAAEEILKDEKVVGLLQIEVDVETQTHQQQASRGRPGPKTEYREVVTYHYHLRYQEDEEALAREALRDGWFPFMTNDESLSVAEALSKYKYQPFVEKRHEQLKNHFEVAPMYLKNVSRIESMLWVYYVVELVGALVEREVRRAMERSGVASLDLYPEGRPTEAPTTGVLFDALEGQRRHRLLDEEGRELRRFHDPLSDAARQALKLLGVDMAPYGEDQANG